MVSILPVKASRPRRKRCLNDGKLFLPAPNRRREDCKFCSENCRKEFHKYGGINFHKQRDWITAEVKKATKAIFAALDPILANLKSRLEDLEQLEIDAVGGDEDGMDDVGAFPPSSDG